jgi:hypothetical protein
LVSLELVWDCEVVALSKLEVCDCEVVADREELDLVWDSVDVTWQGSKNQRINGGFQSQPSANPKPTVRLCVVSELEACDCEVVALSELEVWDSVV